MSKPRITPEQIKNTNLDISSPGRIKQLKGLLLVPTTFYVSPSILTYVAITGKGFSLHAVRAIKGYRPTLLTEEMYTLRINSSPISVYSSKLFNNLFPYSGNSKDEGDIKLFEYVIQALKVEDRSETINILRDQEIKYVPAANKIVLYTDKNTHNPLESDNRRFWYTSVVKIIGLYYPYWRIYNRPKNLLPIKLHVDIPMGDPFYRDIENLSEILLYTDVEIEEELFSPFIYAPSDSFPRDIYLYYIREILDEIRPQESKNTTVLRPLSNEEFNQAYRRRLIKEIPVITEKLISKNNIDNIINVRRLIQAIRDLGVRELVQNAYDKLIKFDKEIHNLIGLGDSSSIIADYLF